MRRRWNWDFEDDQRSPQPAPAPAPAPPSPPPAPAPQPEPDRAQPASRANFRLRRGIAAVVLALLLALIIALSGSGHHGSTPSAGAHAGALPRSAAAQPPQPIDDEGAVSATLAYTPFVTEGSREKRDIALTFDDGPGPYTPQVLSVLEAAHVRATFFAIGRMERYFGAVTAQQLRDGDVIGNHTENHPFLARLSAREQHEEMFEQSVRLELQGAPRPRLFRPPYGSFNATTMRVLQSLKMLMVLWSVDTGDYQQPGASVIVQRALAGAKPGGIILLHDGGGTRTQTIEALPAIIHGLRSQGYHLVTVPQLLADDPPPRGLPLPPAATGD
jgi:peptidoglycan/xylan/chitin deacetylase (PgdA/CDA1 family)